MLKFIVTGASQGIGYEIVKSILANGDFVIFNDIDAEQTRKAEYALRALGYSNYVTLVADSASESFFSQLDTVIDQTPGILAGGVCNAGITTFGDFWTYSKESMEEILRINIKGTFFLIQLIAKKLKEQQLPGSIVLTSSVTGHIAHPDLAVYGMTKAALNQLAKNLVIDLSPYQIRINTVSPGATLTERTLSDTNYQQSWSEITPMGKPATVGDISDAVLFFLSNQSKHITGQNLVVDGGWTSVGIPPK